MARRRRAERRELIPDPRYNSELVAYMINCVMERGKKSVAAKIVYGALEDIQGQLVTKILYMSLRPLLKMYHLDWKLNHVV